MQKEQRNLLCKLPQVDEILRNATVQQVLANHPRRLVKETVRELLNDLRERIRQGWVTAETDLSIEKIVSVLPGRVQSKVLPNLCKVVNATGVVLHTNLGRAVLSVGAREAIKDIASGYCNLEFDLGSGARGSRYAHVVDLLKFLTGAEDVLVVNNNAAGVLLALSALASGREVIVSRGQLVEIGGSFRVPEIMSQSGAQLVEVGSTNRTYLSDYEAAISENTALLLKVHTSNYRIQGFTCETTLEELVTLGKKRRLLVMEDMGSGCLVNLKSLGIGEEPTVSSAVKAGADVVCFSGDKLLGGPQAGIIVGRQEVLKLMKEHPLNRAVRVGKLTIGALEATLKSYIDPEIALREIPTLRMLTISPEELEERSEKLRGLLQAVLGNEIQVTVRKDLSEAGGGSLPTVQIPTYAVAIQGLKRGAGEWAACLRGGDPAILVRVHDGKLLMDVRTILPEETALIVKAFQKCKQKILSEL